MATRKAGSRLETEIERCRSECQWERIPELVKQLSAKLIANDDMAELLLGESKLEQSLKEHPLRQGASPRGPRPQLTEVRKHLTAALDRGNLKSEFLQESNLIMAKLNYVEGDYKEALNIYARVGLDDLPLTAVPPYRLRMIAEAYATKGLCLEKLPVSSSTSNLHVDREQDVITCYEKAGDIALLYLQEIERVILTNIQNRSPKPGPAPHDQELGFFLETGLQRAHVLYFKNGNLTRGVGRFREILRAVETRTTQNLRMTIARQLAEILLRGMCEQSYWNPLEDPPCQSPLDDPLRKGANTKTYILTRKARVYSGENIFCPQENTEEALLLLLISESMANRDAVLSRIPEHKSDRLISLQSASVVYDLLTIALGRRGQYEMLSECLERAMKFAFEEFQLWYQFALSLMAAGKSARAVKVLKECIRLKPDDATIPLLAAKLCMGSLHWLEEAEKFAKTVVDAGEKTSEFKAKGYLALGLTYSLQATDASLRGMQEVLQRKALLAFQRLLFSKVKLESLCRGPDEALLTCKHMLQIWKSCYNLTNPSDSGRGSSLLDRTIADRRQLNTITLPDFSDPETVSDSSSSSLSRTESPLHLFVSPHLHSHPKPDIFVWPPAAHSFNDPGPRQEPSLCNSPEVYFHGFPSLFSVSSVHATSVAASRVEQALSEVASSLQSSAPKQGPLHPWMTLAQIWLHAAEVYIGIGKPAEATACTQEAANLFPMSHNVLYMRGQVAELRGNLDEARRWYEEALSISPTHVKSMQRLALILHQLGRYSLAEKILRDAVQVNSTAHEVWNGLGEVLQAQGNDAAATECFLTALELEASSPAVPFTIIPRVL
ncbi:tetratricopeptide repeat protein 7B isoform X7 [Callorhinus ursinus]|uniref:Tetratricopeptide repeat protein 7B isoform X5 n=1 Tax=Zalophus californianus TaxID=9704 RepID=A0A6P9FEI4_ZALCA|nr:tetratricopeptide repeat protein 7B isoform X5 [Zalophus californianus]